MLYTSSVCQTQPLLPLLLLLLSPDRNVLILFQPYTQVKLYSQEPVALQPSDIYIAALAEILKKAFSYSPCPVQDHTLDQPDLVFRLSAHQGDILQIFFPRVRSDLKAGTG